MGRNIIDTINVLLKIVPQEHEHFEVFQDSMNKIKRSVGFTAPEALHTRWIQVGKICRVLFPPETVSSELSDNIERCLLGSD